MSTITVTPGAGTVAAAGRAYAAERSEPVYAEPEFWEVAEAAAYRLAAVYPVADNAVEVFISPEAVAYAVSEFRVLTTADRIADAAATVILDIAGERAGTPLATGQITTIAPGILRLTW